MKVFTNFFTQEKKRLEGTWSQSMTMNADAVPFGTAAVSFASLIALAIIGGMSKTSKGLLAAQVICGFLATTLLTSQKTGFYIKSSGKQDRHVIIDSLQSTHIARAAWIVAVVGAYGATTGYAFKAILQKFMLSSIPKVSEVLASRAMALALMFVMAVESRNANNNYNRVYYAIRILTVASVFASAYVFSNMKAEVEKYLPELAIRLLAPAIPLALAFGYAAHFEQYGVNGKGFWHVGSSALVGVLFAGVVSAVTLSGYELWKQAFIASFAVGIVSVVVSFVNGKIVEKGLPSLTKDKNQKEAAFTILTEYFDHDTKNFKVDQNSNISNTLLSLLNEIKGLKKVLATQDDAEIAEKAGFKYFNPQFDPQNNNITNFTMFGKTYTQESLFVEIGTNSENSTLYKSFVEFQKEVTELTARHTALATQERANTGLAFAM